MLEQLLAEIHKGGTLQPAALADQLHVSPGLVEMMLEDLERRGLLVQVNLGGQAAACDSAASSKACGGCPLVGECAFKTPQGRMWMASRKN